MQGEGSEVSVISLKEIGEVLACFKLTYKALNVSPFGRGDLAVDDVRLLDVGFTKRVAVVVVKVVVKRVVGAAPLARIEYDTT